VKAPFVYKSTVSGNLYVDGKKRIQTADGKYWFSFDEIARQTFCTLGRNAPTIEDAASSIGDNHLMFGMAGLLIETVENLMDPSVCKYTEHAMRVFFARRRRACHKAFRLEWQRLCRKHGPCPRDLIRMKIQERYLEDVFKWSELQSARYIFRYASERLTHPIAGPKTKLQKEMDAWLKRRKGKTKCRR
jgi:hypothetical protein